eukprot:UN31343
MCDGGQMIFGNGQGAGECAEGVVCVVDPNFYEADNCGSESESGEIIDCTRQGDNNAKCVDGDYCRCSSGYVCPNGTDTCDSGDVCWNESYIGGFPWACGMENQGLEAIDCGPDGFCVFGNHCGCTRPRHMCQGDKGYMNQSGLGVLSEY